MATHSRPPSTDHANVAPPDGAPLPTMLTLFVGRQRELSDLRDELAATRCLNLIGPGGCGKTRLAHRVAQSVEARFADGVCWVELAAIQDPAFVVSAVAHRLKVTAQPELSLLTVLTAKLADSQLLLVLDNCEHLLATCAELVETLLRSTPIQIVVTSREALGVTGEMLYPVPPFTLPMRNQPLAAIAATDAIQFFTARAQHPTGLCPDSRKCRKCRRSLSPVGWAAAGD